MRGTIRGASHVVIHLIPTATTSGRHRHHHHHHHHHPVHRKKNAS